MTTRNKIANHPLLKLPITIGFFVKKSTLCRSPPVHTWPIRKASGEWRSFRGLPIPFFGGRGGGGSFSGASPPPAARAPSACAPPSRYSRARSLRRLQWCPGRARPDPGPRPTPALRPRAPFRWGARTRGRPRTCTQGCGDGVMDSEMNEVG